jgi:phosphoenolpyruvate synthase/pyruvate phosphate dikinase
MSNIKPTTIWLKQETKEILGKIGKKGETYDEIIKRLIQKELPVFGLDLKGRKLYRQGVDARPYFVIPYTDALRSFGRKSSIAWFYGRKNYSYWDENVVTDIAREILIKQVFDKEFINNMIKNWQEIVNKQIKLESEIKNLDNKSNQEIVSLTHKLVKIAHESWMIGINIETFDPKGEELIEEFLTKYDDSNLSIKEFKILCATKESTNIQKEMISLYDIALTKISDEKSKALEEHANNFFWINNTWSDAKILDRNFFIAKLNRLEQEKINFKLELEKIKEKQKQTSEQKKEILKKHPELREEVKRIIDFFKLMTEWRERRKKYALISNHYFSLLLSETAKRTNVKKELLYFLVPEEVQIPLPKNLQDSLYERAKFCMIYINDKETPTVVCDDKTKEFVDEIKASQTSTGERLYGNVANPGKVEGRAKVIFTETEINKMEKGDILVAPCTRPEYLPAMKKASAIITDEGGITSHAAIVSRELGVPCIVGVQNGTDVIKDGDIIEVNANHGIVSVKKA